MKTRKITLPLMSLLASLALTASSYAHGEEEHAKPEEDNTQLDEMIEMHKGHHHEHDFEAIQALPPEEMQQVLHAMRDIGLAVPPMHAQRGRELFVSKGCVVCHQVNGVGGQIGPSFDAGEMPSTMHAFEFAARMWRGAGAMIEMQKEMLGGQIDLTGQELLDLIAFAHDEAEQKKLSESDIPPEYRKLIAE